jgi:DNA-binding NtrC family response regulator
MAKAIVLIVEDEVLIRMNAVQMLEDAGYVAVEAGGADEAIAILECRSDVGAVFTDITMAGSMDGLKLAHAINRRWPPIHLVVTSGMHLIEKANMPANGRFIAKPYTAQQVVSALRELFGHILPLDPLTIGTVVAT